MLTTLFPSLRDISMLRSWVRFEAVTPDDRFLAGRLPREGLLIASGDNGTGFCRSPSLQSSSAASYAVSKLIRPTRFMHLALCGS